MFMLQQLFPRYFDGRLRRPLKQYLNCVTLGKRAAARACWRHEWSTQKWTELRYRQGLLELVLLFNAFVSFWHCENQALHNSFAALTRQEAADYSWNEMVFFFLSSWFTNHITDIYFLIAAAAFFEDWKEALNMEENCVYLNYSLPRISLIKFQQEPIYFLSVLTLIKYPSALKFTAHKS